MCEKYKISVIVPIYGVENYLVECIESVINQTYKNIEIILVEDGSPDNSSEICDRYAKLYKRVTVIHKNNGGLSDARNCGIKASTGDYITFLDGDDFWSNNEAVSNIVNRLLVTKADVLNYSYVKYFEDVEQKVPYFKDVLEMPTDISNKEEQLEYLMDRGLYIASACNKMIKRSLFNDDLLFQKGIYSEDIEWCARLMIKAQSMDFICENFYCYRQRKTSITHTINDKKCLDLCNNIIKCFQLSDMADKSIRRSLYCYIAYQYGTFFKVQAQARNEQHQSIERLKEYKWILRYHCGNRKLIVLNLCSRLLGYERTCRISRYIFSR